MMHFVQHAVSRAAGALILLLAVVVSAQQPGPPAAPDHSASPSVLDMTAKSSQSPVRPAADGIDGAATTQPGKADGLGDPAFGGQRHPLYRLSKLDTVDVSFPLSPDFNQTLTVQPDGFVSLKSAASLFVEGMTLPELQDALVRAYNGILREPDITVALKDFDKPYFLASGEVGRPGKYELRSDLTVSEAVAIAGGFTPQARHSEVVVFRRVSAELAESHVVDLKKMLDSRDLREDLHLHPGDLIFVPQSRIAKIRRYVPTNSLSWYMNPTQF